MKKCQCCKNEEATWDWQPWGPGENANQFVLSGWFTRSFPVIKVCALCKEIFEAGDEVQFTYKKKRYIGKDHKVEEKIYTNWAEGQAAMDRGETVRVECEPFSIDPQLLQIAQDLQNKERLLEWKNQG